MKSKGFTLIELLIAFSISLLIILLIFSIFRLSSRSYEKITEQDEISQKIRVLNARISWLIRGIYPYKSINREGKERLFFLGKSDSLGFVTTSVIPETGKPYDLAGLKWVYLFKDSEGLKEKDSIYFLEENLEGNEDGAFVLDNSVESLSCEYLNPVDNNWQDNWDSEKEYLPAAVKIKLRLMNKGKIIEIPEIIVSIRTAGMD
ncbi:MAG: type II secretion system protein GspJ [Thermodesulfovibrionales bacterium]|nr:type II secretion system protein GspJ [Thermodesulfovibrionales bacterium]